MLRNKFLISKHIRLFNTSQLCSSPKYIICRGSDASCDQKNRLGLFGFRDANGKLSEGLASLSLPQLQESIDKQTFTSDYITLADGKPADCLIGLCDESGATHTSAPELDNLKEVIEYFKHKRIQTVFVDSNNKPHELSEYLHLAQYHYSELKKPEVDAPSDVNFSCFTKHLDPQTVQKYEHDWEAGKVYAKAQNLARGWMETPANLLTPTKFAQKLVKLLTGTPSVSVSVRDPHWIREHNMNGLYGVGRESSVFCEIAYHGVPAKPEQHVALVGKGVTFDSGGISIKPSANMRLMRGDMGGAAVVAATMFGLAQLQLPVNVRAYLPLCENMPDQDALRPGDVITLGDFNVEVTNTDAEGRLILADALWYAQRNKAAGGRPSLIVDLATLTGAITVALGSEYTGLFANEAAELARGPLSQSPVKLLMACGRDKLDPFWRMPLCGRDLLSKDTNADFVNSPEGTRELGSSLAAVFLEKFVEDEIPWMHLDIAGVMQTKGNAFLRPGMTGRPTRALLSFLEHISSA